MLFRSIVASKKINKGDIFTEENITCKRPGNGISPMEWYNILGKTAEKEFDIDELITHTNFKWQDLYKVGDSMKKIALIPARSGSKGL